MTTSIDSIKDPLFSLEKLNSITSGDQQAIRHFNEVFIDETLNNDLTSLKESVDREDYSEVNRVAHKMKSSIDLYCIDSIANEIREIEDLAATSKESDRISEILSGVETTLSKVREQITALL